MNGVRRVSLKVGRSFNGICEEAEVRNRSCMYTNTEKKDTASEGGRSIENLRKKD